MSTINKCQRKRLEALKRRNIAWTVTAFILLLWSFSEFVPGL